MLGEQHHHGRQPSTPSRLVTASQPQQQPQLQPPPPHPDHGPQQLPQLSPAQQPQSQLPSPSTYAPYLPPVAQSGSATPGQGVPPRTQPRPQSRPPPPSTPTGIKPDPEHRQSLENLPDNIEDLTPEEANRIIHSHRKVRYGTACWPCRQRKVRCDNQEPCENCVKRDHAKLCSYKPKAPAAAASASASAGARGGTPASATPSGSRKRAHSPGDPGRAATRPGRNGAWPRATLSNVDDSEQVEVSRYMGQNSIPALLRERSPDRKDDDGDNLDVRQGMQSIFGFNLSAPFPLMSTHYLDTMARDIMSELPSDREVLRLFAIYKEIPQPFWGFIIDIEGFEARLGTYFEERAELSRGTPASPMSASWLAMLFGCLAMGSQFSDSSYAVRSRDASKYVQMAFHFLRISNFLLRPTSETIQAMAITGFVLLNDQKAEASWAMLGLCCRLAISLGLHLPCKDDGRDYGREIGRDNDSRQPLDPKSAEMTRRKIWWTCAWHDMLLSLSFDRNPMTNIPCCPVPQRPETATEGLSYLESLYKLSEIIGQRLTPGSSTSYDYINETCTMVERLRASCAPYIRDRPRNALESLQADGIRLHTAFIISVACRPALRRQCPLDAQQKRLLTEKCHTNHIETLRLFLKMHKHSTIPSRSWAFTYHGLSSALLLAILPETRADPAVCQLQFELIAALSDTAAKDTGGGSGSGSEGSDIELSGPLERALLALRRIYSHYRPGMGCNTQQGVAASAGNHGDNGGKSPLPAINNWYGSSELSSIPPAVAATDQLGQTLQQQRQPLQQQVAHQQSQPQLQPLPRQQQPLSQQQPSPQQQQQHLPQSLPQPLPQPLPQIPQPLPPQLPHQPPDLNAHQDAALTMATLSNGGPAALPDMTGGAYPQPPALTLQGTADLGGATAFMSPMEVYDHIFWPPMSEGFNASLDVLPLDFLQANFLYPK